MLANGVTDMGSALLMVADALKNIPMEPYTLPPVLVLITDGHPTDDISRGLQALANEYWGKKAVRIAIGIGSDAAYYVLDRFIGIPEINALQAKNDEQIVQYIKWTAKIGIQASLMESKTE